MSNHYAPQYTTRERLRLVLIMAAICLAIYGLGEFWFFDWLRDYAANANCHFYGSLTGVHILFYSIFVGSPLSLAILILALEGRRSLRVLRLGQNPLPGEKTLRKTRYKSGWAARLQPCLLLAVTVILIGISLWGAQQAQRATQSVAPCDGEAIIHWH